MSDMVRMQIYISKRQRNLLKRLSKARGVSQAELIRQAIDREANQAAPRAGSGTQEAWDQAYLFMRSLQNQGPVKEQPRSWKREDLYEERLIRDEKNPD